MCQACLTRARTWAQQQGPSRGPGACFGPEVTCILGCGQLGPVGSFYSWVLGSDTKYGVACVWHPHLWQAWLKWYILAPQRVQTCPPPHTAAEPDHPSATESLTPSSYLSMALCGSHWVKTTQDQNILFPQGGEHKVLGSHQGSATWDWLGHHGQLTQPLTSNVLTHLVTRPFADSLTRSLLHSLPCSSLIHSHTQSRAHSLSVYGPHMKKEAGTILRAEQNMQNTTIYLFP